MGLLDPERSAELESHLSACRSASEEVRSTKLAELRAQDPELAERLQRALEQAAIPTLNALGAAPPAAPGAPTSTWSGLRHLPEHSSQPSEPGTAAREGPAGVEPAASKRVSCGEPRSTRWSARWGRAIHASPLHS